MLNTRVVRALFANYVTAHVVGDGCRPAEHLQLTLPSLWCSEGPFEHWVVLNVRHRERKHLGRDSAGSPHEGGSGGCEGKTD